MRPGARTFRGLLPLYPAAIESFDLSGYDLVISSSSAWAHAAICDERATHVCYCHNPFRYAWNERDRTLAERARPAVARRCSRGLFGRWREWDWVAAQRVDRYVTNSRTTQRAHHATTSAAIATVVYPPVDTHRFAPGRSAHALRAAVGADVAQADRHRRSRRSTGSACRSWSSATGPDGGRLRSLAGPTIQLHRAGRRRAGGAAAGERRALVVTSVEEFGIAAVEAQAAGRPVMPRAPAALLETVVEGVTGAVERRARTSWPRRWPASTRSRWTRPTASRTRAASTPRSSARRSRARSTRRSTKAQRSAWRPGRGSRAACRMRAARAGHRGVSGRRRGGRARSGGSARARGLPVVARRLAPSHLVAEAERPSGNTTEIDAAELERRSDMLDDARRLNPDPTPDIRKGQLLVIADRNREAVRVLREVVDREPENYEAWLVLRQAAFGVNSRLFRRATLQVLRLNPLARRTARARQ